MNAALMGGGNVAAFVPSCQLAPEPESATRLRGELISITIKKLHYTL